MNCPYSLAHGPFPTPFRRLLLSPHLLPSPWEPEEDLGVITSGCGVSFLLFWVMKCSQLDYGDDYVTL